MNLEDLGNVGEFVGAIAVVVSLLYLAIQIRQNTRSLRSSAHQSITVHIAELNRTIVENREIASILERGFRDLALLSDEEQRRFNAYNSARFRHYDNLYYQYRTGMLEESQWNGLSNLLAFHLLQPGLKSWWRDVIPFYSVEFVEYVNDLQKRIDEGFAIAESAGNHDPTSSGDLW